jgi:hypothetical protein
MDELESEDLQNKFEVEISDLDESDIAGSSKPPRPARRAGFLPGRRRLALLLLNGLLILVFLLIMAGTAPVRQLIDQTIRSLVPTPTATLTPGVDLFYVRANPPWGHLLIDGHLVSLPAIGVNPPLRLARGKHVLVWQAAPFTPQRCTLTVPGRPLVDTCVYNEALQLGARLSAWVITFSVSLKDLTSQQRAALLQATQAALDAQQSTDTVQPGEHYALAPESSACAKIPFQLQCYATARQPLRATLSFQLDANENSTESCIDSEPSCTYANQNCHLFCTLAFLEPATTPAWDAVVPVFTRWTFATMDGQVLARNVPDNSYGDRSSGQTTDESLVPLRITWNSSDWQVTVLTDPDTQDSGYLNPACAATLQEVRSFQPPVDANGMAVTPQWYFASDALATGCLAAWAPQPDTITPTPGQIPRPVICCLHRFGVLLALNRQAQQPGQLLPLANAYEQQIARRLMKRIHT